MVYPLFEIKKVVQSSWSKSCLKMVVKSLEQQGVTNHAQHQKNIRQNLYDYF